MKPRIYLIFALVTLVAGLLGFPQVGVRAESLELYVDAAGACAGHTPCYLHPQDAVNAANPGDTILVYPGTYGSRSSACPAGTTCTDSDLWAPALIVYKDNLTIRSVDGPANTIIQSTHMVSSNAGPVERSTANGITGKSGWNASAAIIVANNITIDGFTFHRPFNCSEINACFWNTAGVFVGGQAVGSADFLGRANGATVKNSVFSTVWQAVLIWHSKDDTVFGNTVETLGSTGITAGISAYDGYDNRTIGLVPQSQNLLIQNNSLADKGVSLGADAGAGLTSNAGSKICSNSLTQVVVANSQGPVLAGGNTGTFLQLDSTDVLNVSGITYTGPVTSTTPTVSLTAQVAYAGSVDGSGIPVTFRVNGADHAATTTAGGSASVNLTLSDGTYPISVTYSACGAYTATASLIVNTDAQGPLVTSLAAAPNPVTVGASLVVTATLDDTTTGGSLIASAQYAVDGGAKQAMTGTFNAVTVTATATLPNLSLGEHAICVTGTDAKGNTGPERCIQVTVVEQPDTQGPLVTSLAAAPESVTAGTLVVITAVVDDTTTGGSIVAGAKVVVDAGAKLAMEGSFNAVTVTATATLPDLAAGNHNICVTGTDAKGNTGPERCIQVTVAAPLDTQGPLVTSLEAAPNPVTAGTPLVITAVVDDTTTGGSLIAQAQYAVDGGAKLAMEGAFDAVSVTATATLADLSAGEHSICVTGTDAAGNTGPERCIQVTVAASLDTQGPLVTSLTSAPHFAMVGTPVVLTAVVDDTTTGGSIVTGAQYALDGGDWLPMEGPFDAVVVTATVTLSDLSAGDHCIYVTGTDAAGNTGPESCITVTLYGPRDGFVSANGWFMSPEGAYAADPALTGKAHVNIQAKSKKGADFPTGSTKFQLKAADFSFAGTGYDWLVIDGAKVLLKGTGTVNGEGSYAFMITLMDGGARNGAAWNDGDWNCDDRSCDAGALRIQIWDPASGQVLYDNQPGADDGADPITPLCGGSIVIHK